MGKQIKEINEEIKKAIQRIENIWKKYDELREKYKAKEQECETLASQLDFEVQKKECLEQECEELKERLNCNCFGPKNNNNRCISYNRIAEDYERDLQQLDQLKEQLEAYKMEAEEGKEINAELKAENEELRQILWNVDFNRQSKGKKLIRIEELLKKCATGYTDEFIQEMFSILYELEPVCRYNKLEKYSKTLTEIKEFVKNEMTQNSDTYIILQKISECEVD